MYARFYLLVLWLALGIALAKLTKGVYKTWTTPIAEGETKINSSAFFLTLMLFAFVMLVSLITLGMAQAKIGRLATTIFFIAYVFAFLFEHIISKRKLKKIKPKSQEIIKPTPIWLNTMSYLLGIFSLPLFWYTVHLIIKGL